MTKVWNTYILQTQMLTFTQCISVCLVSDMPPPPTPAQNSISWRWSQSKHLNWEISDSKTLEIKHYESESEYMKLGNKISLHGYNVLSGGMVVKQCYVSHSSTCFIYVHVLKIYRSSVASQNMWRADVSWNQVTENDKVIAGACPGVW